MSETTSLPYMSSSLLTVRPLNASGMTTFAFGVGGNAVALAISQGSLIAWYKADAITGVSSGSSLSSWLNSSQAVDVTLASAASTSLATEQPFFRSAGVNGKPSVEFNFGQMLQPKNLSFGTPYTAFVVSSCSSIVNAASVIGLPPTFFVSTAGTQWDVAGNSTLASLRSYSTNENIFLGAIANGSASTFVAGTSGNSNVTTGNIGVAGLSQFAIGARPGFSSPWGGQVAEVILYAIALPDTSFQAVLTYLINKYGLS